MLLKVQYAYRNTKFRFKGWLFKQYLQMHGCKVGKGLKCMNFPRFRLLPNKNIFIGDYVTFGWDCTLEIAPEGKLIIEDYVLFADRIQLTSLAEIKIGKWSAIAENASIRDCFHDVKKDELFRLQPSSSSPIEFGEDTGVGAGTVILMGSKIQKGAWIGSNSVVTRSCKIEPYGIYAGAPAKFVKFRD